MLITRRNLAINQLLTALRMKNYLIYFCSVTVYLLSMEFRLLLHSPAATEPITSDYVK